MKKKNRGLFDEIMDKINRTTEEVRVLTGHVYSGIEDDVRELAELGRTKIENLIDLMVDDNKIEKMLSAFFAHAKKGKKAAIDAFMAEYAKYQDYLNEEVDDHREMVGFLDGFASVFSGGFANRRPKSRVYMTHAKYGKVLGIIASVGLFCQTGMIMKLVGAMPVISRLLPYLQEKVAEAMAKSKE